jgi:RND family efflux transporter MFP subunit
MKNSLTKRLARLLLPVFIVGAGIALTVAMIIFKEQPESTPVAERVAAVETMTVRSTDITFTVASQGTVTPRTETAVVAEVSGKVISVSEKLVAGGYFNQGEVLLAIDSADYQVAVEQARANLLTAQAQLSLEAAQAEQAGKQWDLSGRSRESAPLLALRTPFLLEAEARVLSAESDLQRAERQLARTTIRAPYDALVREKSVDLGQYLGMGNQIARIFATDYAEVRLPLSDSDLAWLALPRPGQLAGVEASPVFLHAVVAGREQHWQGTIVRTEGVVDSNSRMHFAVARIADPYALRKPDKSPLSAGTFVNARLSGINVSNIFSLPHNALYNGNEVLLMDAEQRLRRREVNVIRSDADWVYIDRGLRDGEQVIVSPVQIALEGMRVNPAVAPVSSIAVPVNSSVTAQ